MSSPSFLVRLRSRNRRPGQGEGVALQLPADHWHAGDPRMVDGSLALRTNEVPAPRRPMDAEDLSVTTDRRLLSLVPEVDVRGGVVDLRAPNDLPPPSRARPGTAQLPAAGPAESHAWSETSTWLG